MVIAARLKLIVLMTVSAENVMAQLILTSPPPPRLLQRRPQPRVLLQVLLPAFLALEERREAMERTDTVAPLVMIVSKLAERVAAVFKRI
ncbi:hypothetical protein RMCBS344292_05009 [Rhizopus microsporus]|nr:hypothetical protein RMCBS344292_05009 [Rhizopus microsporus]